MEHISQNSLLPAVGGSDFAFYDWKWNSGFEWLLLTIINPTLPGFIKMAILFSTKSKNKKISLKEFQLFAGIHGMTSTSEEASIRRQRQGLS